jgi:hypothetical protein
VASSTGYRPLAKPKKIKPTAAAWLSYDGSALPIALVMASLWLLGIMISLLCLAVAVRILSTSSATGRTNGSMGPGFSRGSQRKQIRKLFANL